MSNIQKERERERETTNKRKKLNLVPNNMFYAIYAFYAEGKVKIKTSRTKYTQIEHIILKNSKNRSTGFEMVYFSWV